MSRRPMPAGQPLWGPPVENSAPKVRKVSPASPRPSWSAAQVLFAGCWFLGMQVPLALALSMVAANRAGGRQPTPDEVIAVAMTPAMLVVSLLFQWSIFLGYPWLVSRWRGQKSMRLDFGLFATRRDVAIGLLVGVGLQGLMLLFGNLFPVEGSGNTNALAEAKGATLIILAFSAGIAAPIVEEVFFRGLILRGFLRTFARVDLSPVHEGVTSQYRDNPPGVLRRRAGVALSLVASSVIFGFMHLQSNDSGGIGFGQWLVVIQTGVLGLVFAVIALKMKRLGFVIAAHMGFNLTAVILTLMFVR